MINRRSLTKTETALEDGLDPTAEEIGVVQKTYHEAPMVVNGRISQGNRILLSKDLE